MPLLLGPVLDLLFIAMLSRHRMFWLGAAVLVMCGFALFANAPGTGASGLELVGGAR